MKNDLEKLQLALDFTEVYKKYKNSSAGIREMKCLETMFPRVLGDIRESDLFAGRDDQYGPIGFVPEPNGHGHKIDGYCYYFYEDYFNEEINKAKPDAKMLASLEEVRHFWLLENTQTITRNRYPDNMASTLFSDNFTGEPAMAFPLYRMGGIFLDYEKLLRLGVDGLLKEISSLKDFEMAETLEMAINIFQQICDYYALQAEESGKPEISKTLRKIRHSRPETLFEAIQLAWLYNIPSCALNYGRMDDYLGDFYVKDIDSKLITESEAQEMLNSLWQLIADRRTVFNGRVIIGGKGRHNEQNADRFALAAIEATRTIKEIEPQLSLRFYEGMSPKLMDSALKSIGEGRTYPILYNDDINVPAVEKAFRVSRKQAEQYMPFGCGEYVLNHCSFGTPSGVINLTKVLEEVLKNNFDTFESLYDAYKSQVTSLVELLADQESLEYKVVSEVATFPFLTMLYDDCLAQEKFIFSGGLKYLGGTLETYGNTNTADSLLAIKKLVFEKKTISYETMLKALDANFEGFEDVQKQMLNVPKFGNDDFDADFMAINHHEFICNVIRNQIERTDLHSYLAVIINNNANTIFGAFTGASPDGRKAGAPLANANMPSAGSDKLGVTAVMNSQVKLSPSIHAGSVQNLKLSKELFSDNLLIVKALLKTYFASGGTQIMITVLNCGDLENAMKEPEKYQNLFVRVGGFSARFVELDKSIQLEILSRTLH
ncbi:MAG: pyruvate formate lyase family protein [Bacillota bacterium]